MDLELLLAEIKKLPESDRQQIIERLMHPAETSIPKLKHRKFDLFPGMIQIDNSFDDPLSDDFWLGEE